MSERPPTAAPGAPAGFPFTPPAPGTPTTTSGGGGPPQREPPEWAKSLIKPIADLIQVVTEHIRGLSRKQLTVRAAILIVLGWSGKWIHANVKLADLQNFIAARQTSDIEIARTIGTLTEADSGRRTSTLATLGERFHYNPVLAERARPHLVSFVREITPASVPGKPCPIPGSHVQTALTLALKPRVYRPFPWFRKREVLRAEGDWSLKGRSLASVKLDALDLRQLDLEGACLSGASLKHALLDTASLVGARLEGANLTGASLRHANFGGAVLVRATIDSTTLDSARFVKSTLLRARFEGARGTGVDFNEAQLTYADLRGATLRASVFDYALASCASFERAKLPAARFIGAHLAWSDLDSADLTGVRDFPGNGSGSVKGAFLGSAILDSALRARLVQDGASADTSRRAWRSAPSATLRRGRTCDREARTG